jgi:type IV pilus assembly protein PilV
LEATILIAVPRNNNSRCERGFTLIEALIAFVILSVGLLGIVSLQAIAKTSQHLAIQHTRAVTIADALVERVRVNPTGIATYNFGLNPRGVGTIGTEPAPNCVTASTPCNPTQLAIHDLWAWESVLVGAGVTISGANAGGLIEPRGCVVFTAAPGRARTGLLTVIIQWRGLHESSDAVLGGEPICGGVAAGTDNFRRQVVVNTYVVDETEF